MNPGATLAAGALLNALAFLSSNLRAIFTFLVARWLGGAVLGTFGVAWAVTDLASKFATLGLDYTVMAFVARSEAAGDRDGSRRIWRSALRLAVPASLAVAIVGFGAAVTSDHWLGVRADLATATGVMFLGVPGIALYRVCNGLSRGMKVMQHDVYSRGLTESLATSAAFLLAIAIGVRDLAPVSAAITGTLASGLVAFVLARRLYAPGRESVGPSATGPSVVDRRDAATGLVRSSIPVAFYDLLNIGIMRIDVILLGLFAGRAPGVSLESVGVYAACVEIAGGLRKLSQAFTPILTPVLAEQIAGGRMREAESSYGYVARWMLAILLPAVCVLGLSGGAILRLFGPGFERGAPWLLLAGSACALNAFVGLGETILLIQRPVWNVFNTTVSFVAAVMLNLILIPLYGPAGAAVGMLVPYAIQGALRGFQLTAMLGWHWPWRALVRPWGAALAPLPVAVLVRIVATGVAAEAAAGLVYVVGYLGVWWAIGLDAEDKVLLSRLRR